MFQLFQVLVQFITTTRRTVHGQHFKIMFLQWRSLRCTRIHWQMFKTSSYCCCYSKGSNL